MHEHLPNVVNQPEEADMVLRMSKFRSLLVFLLVLGRGQFLKAQQVQLVDVIPAQYSSETTTDSEPNVTVNPANINNIVVSAFTPCPPMISTTLAPIYFSQDGGTTWHINCILPGNSSATGTGDITVRFAGPSGVLYAGILRGDSFLEMNILRSPDFTAMTAMDLLVDRSQEDQPYTQAATAGGDHVYIGNNNLSNSTFFVPGSSGKTASVDSSLDAATAPAPAGFGTDLLETRDTCGQDPPPIRPAIHPNGTVYVAYYRNQTSSPCFSGTNTVDVIVARDDNWGSGGFNAITDPDTHAGVRVVQGVSVVWAGSLGNERLQGSQMSIAVDPNNSNVVYVAWADGPSASYTLHVRRSTTGGTSWDPEIKTVSPADNPAIAVNKLGILGFLYQKFVSSGTCNGGGPGIPCWETHFETFDGTTWTDLPHPLANVPDNAGTFVLGDYEHLLAIGQDFYGVFSANNYPDTNNFYPGVHYQRYANFTTHKLYADAGLTMQVNPSFDPFFFHVTMLPPTGDFYVRDWTTTPSSHDNGEEPSTNPVWWTTSDVWNRLDNASNGGFNANDQPNHQNAQDATSGHNYAYVRVHRKAAPMTGPPVTVQARFLFADYGLGVAYQDVSMTPTASLVFNNTDTEQVLPAASGVQWDLPAMRSTHVCMAVEISAPGDPYSPELAGRAPGWPTTDWTLPADNNKAQINMDLPPVAAGSASASFYTIAHNAATFTRDMVVRYSISPRLLAQLQGAEIGVIGGRTQPLRESGTLVLGNMQPGENRWIEVTYSAPNGKQGHPIPISLQEIYDDAVLNGVTLMAQPSPLDQVIRANLKFHRAVFTRLNVAFHIASANAEAQAASKLLASGSLNAQAYLAFLNQQSGPMGSIIAELIKSQRSADTFAANQALKVLQGALATQKEDLVSNDHLSLLNKLDAFQTMLQKAQGDPSDILQMVVWQRRLYSTAPKLMQLKFSKHVVEESDEFINNYGRPKAKGDSYPEFLRELLGAFHDTAEALECPDKRLEAAVAHLKDSFGSLEQLEKAHRAYLLELQAVK
jgi:hypothetical protein